MTRSGAWRGRVRVTLVVLALTVGLVGVLAAVVVSRGAGEPVARPAISLPPTVDGTSPDPTPRGDGGAPAPRTERPDAGLRVEDRFRARYAGRSVTWDALLATATPLPRTTAGCRADWRDARRDAGLDWSRADYLCLDRLTGRGFKPQGLGGSGTTAGYRIGGRPAADRNLVLVSAYSTKPEPGLAFPHRPGRSETTRLTVIDLDRGRYAHVELVKPTDAGTFTALDSHGSGLAWAGQYLYTSSRGSLWMFNADDLLQIDGRYVLPAVAGWSVRGRGGLSSLGLDRTGTSATLTGINYTQTGTAWRQSFPLAADGRLATGGRAAASPLTLTRRHGAVPVEVVSRRSAVVPGTNYQGIGTVGGYTLASSSSLLLDGTRHGDNLVVVRGSRLVARFAMPAENVESLYVDHRRRRLVTVTEHGRQFLFWLPVEHLMDRAER